MTDQDKQWLRDLRLTRQVRDFTIVHATLDTPDQWGYVFNTLDAAASFTYQHTTVCFFGHTHAPGAFVRDDGVKRVKTDQLMIEEAKVFHQHRQRRTAARWRLARGVLHLPRRQKRGRTTPGEIRPRDRAGKNHQGRAAAVARRAAQAGTVGGGRKSEIRGRTLKPEIKSILVIKPSSLGDIVHTLPAVAAVRDAHPRAEITWVINPEWSTLLRGNPDVDHIHIFPAASSPH